MNHHLSETTSTLIILPRCVEGYRCPLVVGKKCSLLWCESCDIRVALSHSWMEVKELIKAIDLNELVGKIRGSDGGLDYVPVMVVGNAIIAVRSFSNNGALAFKVRVVVGDRANENGYEMSGHGNGDLSSFGGDGAPSPWAIGNGYVSVGVGDLEGVRGAVGDAVRRLLIIAT